MIGLLVVDAVLIIILAMKLWDCSANLDRAEYRIDSRGAEIRELKQRCEGHKELIEALSKSVRELNGVVEAAVNVKEQTSDNKPDTKVLVSGWDADEAELEDPVKNHIVDIMLNGTYEQKQDLIDAWTLQSALLGQTQQCIYPWQPWRSGQLQASAMLPPQQCIYPWQQIPTGAMLPLWYINRRLEDM